MDGVDHTDRSFFYLYRFDAYRVDDLGDQIAHHHAQRLFAYLSVCLALPTSIWPLWGYLKN
jgi:hypothetical protein